MYGYRNYLFPLLVDGVVSKLTLLGMTQPLLGVTQPLLFLGVTQPFPTLVASLQTPVLPSATGVLEWTLLGLSFSNFP